MKILERRPSWVRLFGRRPAARENWWTRPLGSVVSSAVRRRAANRPAPPDSPFLVSVGNLALGGTGKTPVVMDLALSFARAGIPGAILTRGYGSALPGPVAVEKGTAGAGDEARLMASRLAPQGWPVIQSARRALALEYLQQNYPAARVAFLEDAHQSAGLARHLDLLILDSWDVIQQDGQERVAPRTGPVFPLGAWRENARGASRAGALLLESEQDLPSTSIHGQPVFAFTRRGTSRWVTPLAEAENRPRRWGLISGIARPEGFESSAAEILPGEVVASARCRDHAPYEPEILRRILAELESEGAEAIATTAKDWVKLESLWSSSLPVSVLDLELVWRQENAPGRWLAERVGLPFSEA